MAVVTGGPWSRRRLAQAISALNSRLKPQFNGLTIFVCSVNGSDSTGYGLDINLPVATLDYAIGLVANRLTGNSLIVVLPGHSESVAAANTALFDQNASLRVIGLGEGRGRPTFTWTNTAGTIAITGANLAIENLVFDMTGVDAVVAGIKVDAADVKFLDCEFITNGASAGVVSGITVGATTTSPRFHVENCTFRGPATNSGTTTTAQLTLTDCPDYRLLNNYFTGKCTQNITNGAALLRGEIHNCRFVTYTGTKSINMHASSTPFITNCRFNVPSGTAPIVAAAGFVAGNVYSAAAGVTAGTASTF